MKYEHSQTNTQDAKWKPIKKLEAIKKISKGIVSYYPENLLKELDTGERSYINLNGYGYIRHKPRKFITGYKNTLQKHQKELIDDITTKLNTIKSDSSQKGLTAKAEAAETIIKILQGI